MKKYFLRCFVGQLTDKAIERRLIELSMTSTAYDTVLLACANELQVLPEELTLYSIEFVAIKTQSELSAIEKKKGAI